jgi:phage baseplate assembly protein W
VAVVPYTVKNGDTVERIALQVYRDSSMSVSIVEYNNLDYPFITDDLDLPTKVKSTGVVLFTRTSSVGTLFIPAGTRVALPATATTPEREYVTPASATIADGAISVATDVECTVPGPFGNFKSGLSMVLKESALAGVSVVSVSGFTGGRTLQVRRPGDVLLIPTEGQSVVVAEERREVEMYRSDLSLSADGDFEIDLSGDLKVVSGVDNLNQALAERIATPLGFYATVPSYGSIIPSITGRRNVPFWTDLLKLEVESTLLSDPRVSRVDNIDIRVDGDSVFVTAKVVGIASDQAQTLTTVL